MKFQAQHQQFVDQGYAVFPGLLLDEPLEILREACDRFVAREDARMDEAGLRQVLFGEAMLDVCRATLGDDAYFFFDQYVVKGPERGLAFGWHQDSGYMAGNGGPADHAPYLTCWCPLDDATVDNGTVRVLPFSAVPAARDAILPHRRQAATRDLTVEVEDQAGVPIEAAAGDVVAFSSRLPHATGPNLTTTPRRVYLAQYTPEAVVDPGTRHLRRNAIALLRGGRRVIAV